MIDEDSAFVFDALDGKTDLDAPNGTHVNSAEINYRDEPVAFFFVLFGLAFEALVSRSGDQSSDRRQALEILRALEKILRPSVAGQAIYQEVIFSEAMDMLDRLVLTESLPVQAVIVQIARNLCLAHPSARKDASAPVEEERLSEDIDQLFELTRIIVLVLAGLIPNLTEDKARVQHVLNDEGVTLLVSALSALVDASSVFPSVIKTDLHACIMHVFATILATPSCQQSVVPQALPIFRRFLAGLAPTARSPASSSAALVRASLARYLVILNHAQTREFPAAVQCEKNILLASTILLSSTSSAVSHDDPILRQFTESLLECLSSRVPTKTAASCARTLLLLPKRSATDDAIAAQLLPGLLDFIVHTSDVEDLDESRAIMCQVLVAVCQTFAVDEGKASAAIALILPAQLARAATAGSGAYRDTAARILEMAGGKLQGPFRSAANGLSEEQKSLLQEIIKEGGAGARKVEVQEVEAPTIALKMDF